MLKWPLVVCEAKSFATLFNERGAALKLIFNYNGSQVKRANYQKFFENTYDPGLLFNQNVDTNINKRDIWFSFESHLFLNSSILLLFFIVFSVRLFFEFVQRWLVFIITFFQFNILILHCLFKFFRFHLKFENLSIIFK